MVLRSASYRLRPWVRDPVRGIVRGGLIVRLEARWSELSPTSWEVSRRPVAVHYQARVAAAGESARWILPAHEVGHQGVAAGRGHNACFLIPLVKTQLDLGHEHQIGNLNIEMAG